MNVKTYDESTANDFALVGLIFFSLSTIGGLVIRFVAFQVFSWNETTLGELRIRNPRFSLIDPTFILIALGVLAIIAVFFTILAYLTYKKIKQGRYADARFYTLILGIFGLFPFFGAVLGGIFFILTFWKLGEILQADQQSQITISQDTTQKE